jgi:hypothetical protein
MKKTLTILFCVLSIYVQAQINAFGIDYSRHLATQLHFNPQFPQNGTFQPSQLRSNGIGVFVHYQIPKSRFSIQSNFKSITKGFTERLQITQNNGRNITSENIELKSSFDYLNLDLRLGYAIIKEKYFVLNPYLGLRNGFLTSFTLKNGLPRSGFTRISPLNRNFNTYEGGIVIGLNTKIADIIFIEGETNMGLTHLVKSPDLEIRNWVSSLNIGVNILRLRPKQKVKNKDSLD